MSNISLRQYALRLGSNSVRGMAAARLGWGGYSYPFSVREALGLPRINLPLAPVDLQPQNGAQNVAHDPFLFWRDPGAGTPAAALKFVYLVTQNGTWVGDFRGSSAPEWPGPPPPPGIKWEFPLPSGEVTLHVTGSNRYGSGPESKSTFTVGAAPHPPQPPQNPYPVPLKWQPGTPMYVQSDPVYADSPTIKVLKVGNKNTYGHRCALKFPNNYVLNDGGEATPAQLGLPSDQMLGMVITATPGSPLDGQSGEWDVSVELTWVG